MPYALERRRTRLERHTLSGFANSRCLPAVEGAGLGLVRRFIEEVQLNLVLNPKPGN